jgi:GNAT superfamily N-acetyltransferase
MIRIRGAGPDDAPALWRVQIATTDTTFRGLVPDDVYTRMCADVRRASRWPEWLANTRSFTLAAEAERGELVGYATGGYARPDPPGWQGELYLLYILQPYQRQGIGRRLVTRVAERLAAWQLRSMVVWSLATNRPSRRFYEALGARFVEGRRIPDFDIAIYGWDDLTPLTLGALRPGADPA